LVRVSARSWSPSGRPWPVVAVRSVAELSAYAVGTTLSVATVASADAAIIAARGSRAEVVMPAILFVDGGIFPI
jgi:hypothetical protein